MSCLEIIADYGLRSIGFGERLLPRSDFTLCHQFTLIGSGMIWNIYFGTLALTSGFILANLLALGKASKNFYVKKQRWALCTGPWTFKNEFWVFGLVENKLGPLG